MELALFVEADFDGGQIVVAAGRESEAGFGDGGVGVGEESEESARVGSGYLVVQLGAVWWGW